MLQLAPGAAKQINVLKKKKKNGSMFHRRIALSACIVFSSYNVLAVTSTQNLVSGDLDFSLRSATHEHRDIYQAT